MISSEFIEMIRGEEAEISLDEPMSLHTTFRIGGNADVFCEVKTRTALKNIVSKCRENGVPYFLLGLGSNILVSDSGIGGVVIKLEGEFNDISLCNENTIVCGAGVSLAGLCVYARKYSLGGLEFAWGIPGSVGGAIYMNAGAYGGEIKDVADFAEYLDTDGEIKKYTRDELDFGYRHSVFTDTDKIILSAGFCLTPKNRDEINDRMQELMDRRRTKQPTNHPSAGSVFKRPEGYYAAALIEECGLKGYGVGGAVVSPKHSGFIVNDGGATAEDVKAVIAHVKEVVKEKKGVDLQCEVKFIG